MCKLDLKDAYFSVPVGQNSRKFVRILWKGTLYEFVCLCFGLGQHYGYLQSYWKF